MCLHIGIYIYYKELDHVIQQGASAGSWPRTNQHCNVSPKAGKTWDPSLKALKEEFSFTGWGGGQVAVRLIYSDLPLIDSGPVKLRKSICFTGATDLNVNVIQKYPRRNTQNDTETDIWWPRQGNTSYGPSQQVYSITAKNLDPAVRQTQLWIFASAIYTCCVAFFSFT